MRPPEFLLIPLVTLTIISTCARATDRWRDPELDSRCDLKGLPVKVAVSSQPPLVDCHQNQFGEWICVGSNIELVHLLARKLNFRPEWVVLASRGDHLTDFHSGNESARTAAKNRAREVMDLVASGRALMSANGIMRVTGADNQTARGGSLSISEPFDAFKLHLLLSKSVRDHDHIFIKPFQPQAWAAILLSAALIVPAMYWTNSTSSHYLAERHLFTSDLEFAASPTACLRHLWAKWSRRLREFAGCGCDDASGRRATLPPPSLLSSSSSLSLSTASSDNDPGECDSRQFEFTLDKMLTDDSFRGLGPEATTGEVRRAAGVHPSEGGFGTGGAAARGDAKSEALLAREYLRHLRKIERRMKNPMENSDARAAAAKRRKRGSRRRRRDQRNRGSFSNFGYVVWYVVASLAGQGGETEDLPQANSTRILVAFWWFQMIVICSIHSGVLTAILTFPKQLDFIQTFEDFLNLEVPENSDGPTAPTIASGGGGGESMRLVVDRYGEISELLARGGDEAPGKVVEKRENSYLARSPLRRLANPIVQTDFARHREKTLSEILRGKSAYLGERAAINLIITGEYLEQQRCQFKASKHPIDVIPMSLVLNARAVPRECLEAVDRLLVRVRRTGLARKWRRRHEAQGNDCLDTVVINAGDVSSIELRHVLLGFWLLFGGLAAGGLILVLEIMCLFSSDDLAGDDASGDLDLVADSPECDENDNDNDESESSGRSASSLSGGHLEASAAATTTGETGRTFGPARFRLGHRRAKVTDEQARAWMHRHQVARGR